MLGSFVIRGKKIQFSLSAVFNVVFFFFICVMPRDLACPTNSFFNVCYF